MTADIKPESPEASVSVSAAKPAAPCTTKKKPAATKKTAAEKPVEKSAQKPAEKSASPSTKKAAAPAETPVKRAASKTKTAAKAEKQVEEKGAQKPVKKTDPKTDEAVQKKTSPKAPTEEQAEERPVIQQAPAASVSSADGSPVRAVGARSGLPPITPKGSPQKVLGKTDFEAARKAAATAAPHDETPAAPVRTADAQAALAALTKPGLSASDEPSPEAESESTPSVSAPNVSSAVFSGRTAADVLADLNGHWCSRHDEVLAAASREFRARADREAKHRPIGFRESTEEASDQTEPSEDAFDAHRQPNRSKENQSVLTRHAPMPPVPILPQNEKAFADYLYALLDEQLRQTAGRMPPAYDWLRAQMSPAQAHLADRIYADVVHLWETEELALGSTPPRSTREALRMENNPERTALAVGTMSTIGGFPSGQPLRTWHQVNENDGAEDDASSDARQTPFARLSERCREGWQKADVVLRASLALLGITVTSAAAGWCASAYAVASSGSFSSGSIAVVSTEDVRELMLLVNLIESQGKTSGRAPLLLPASVLPQRKTPSDLMKVPLDDGLLRAALQALADRDGITVLSRSALLAAPMQRGERALSDRTEALKTLLGLGSLSVDEARDRVKALLQETAKSEPEPSLNARATSPRS